MARLACCLVLISLCLCLVLEPALATKKGHNKKPMVYDPIARFYKMPMVKSTKHFALAPAPSQGIVLPPASAPFPIIVPSEYIMAKQLCQDTRQPELCHKIIQGGKIDPVTEAKVTIEIASSMALRASAYMSKISNRKDIASGALNSCMLSYEKAIIALNLSYINFQTNPKNAIQSLRKADYHVGFCTDSLGHKNDIPPVLKANKAMQGMIKAASFVAKEQAH
ncbi:hypothetical protein Lal_00019070 [Lupinus albus]|uniref:Putative pectinesterase inhibitor domain-containing protein n=1 Tax=Lupinus albus TaxID=3870 RepID=A0A6A4R286_LUPAL|nr:putative pectinesterase inhibitor domain-containing protein [Lupinus albus]KAF1898949.1 hypothetical protein Lal_00019070 [Lupinus albus]